MNNNSVVTFLLNMYAIYIIIIVMLYMYVFVKTTLCFSKLRAYSFYFTKKTSVCVKSSRDFVFSVSKKSFSLRMYTTHSLFRKTQ